MRAARSKPALHFLFTLFVCCNLAAAAATATALRGNEPTYASFMPKPTAPSSSPSSTLTAFKKASFPDLLLLVETIDPNTVVSLFAGSEIAQKLFVKGHLYDNVSTDCASSIRSLRSDIVTSRGKDQWAWRFIDAAGRPQAGLLDGNLYWYGSRDECADVLRIDNSNRDRGFAGRYCVADFTIGLKWGFCIPDKCSKQDFLTIWANIARLITSHQKHQPNKNGTSPALVQVTNAVCDTTASEWHLDGPAIAFICIVALFGFFVAAGTLLETWLLFRSKPKTVVAAGPSAESVANKNSSALQVDRSPIYVRLLLAFSALSNGRKILATNDNPPMSALHRNASDAATTTTQLYSVHGIRFLSMTWVILGHTYAYSLLLISNAAGILSASKAFLFQLIINGTLSVDTFFLISGMLLVYLFMQEWQKRKRVNWLLYYFHRYWRLTPVYMICIGFVAGILPLLLSGPNQYANDQWAPNRCAGSWWWNLLYINNFRHYDDQCAAWTWYLANDMQFYMVVAPLVLIPLIYIGMWSGLCALGVFLVGHLISTAVVSGMLDLPVNVIMPNMAKDHEGIVNYYKWYYMRPWTRVGPYLIGMLLGLLLFTWQQRNAARRRDRRQALQLPWTAVVGAWTVAAGVSLAVVFAFYPMFRDGDDYELPVRVLYNTVARIAWSVCVAWAIFACETGYGGFVNRILSWQALVPLSRLTYCAYLFHLPIITLVNGNTTQEMVFSHLTLVLRYFGFLFATYLMAFVVSVVFEAPMLGLEKVLLAGIIKTPVAATTTNGRLGRHLDGKNNNNQTAPESVHGPVVLAVPRLSDDRNA